MQPSSNFKNLLGRDPTKKYVIVSDVETKGICTVRRTWLDLHREKFFYPNRPKSIRKVLKEVQDPDIMSWLEFTLDYIYDEAGN